MFTYEMTDDGVPGLLSGSLADGVISQRALCARTAMC